MLKKLNKKMRKLEKEYENCPDEAVIKKARIEKSAAACQAHIDFITKKSE